FCDIEIQPGGCFRDLAAGANHLLGHHLAHTFYRDAFADVEPRRCFERLSWTRSLVGMSCWCRCNGRNGCTGLFNSCLEICTQNHAVRAAACKLADVNIVPFRKLTY